MIDPRYSDDEQAERLKEWWKQNGTSVIVGATLGIGIIVGVNLWRDHTKNQAESASQQYSRLLTQQESQALDSGENLKTEYGRTPYAALGALYLAKIGYEEGDLAKTESNLRWALDNAKEDSTRHVARLRLARLYLEQDRVGEAEELAVPESYDGFDSQYYELSGDISMLREDAKSAQDAYEKAIASIPRGSSYSEMLVLKLDRATGSTGQ